jgi:hypothetical protein
MVTEMVLVASVWSQHAVHAARRCAVGASGLLILMAGCLLPIPSGEPAPVPPTINPGFVAARPFPAVRTLHDVVVLGVDAERITRAIAVGTDGAILHWDGASWSRENAPVASQLWSVSGGTNDEGRELVVAVGDDGVVLRRESGGWVVVPSPVTTDLFSVWVRSADDAFIVGDRGTVLRYDGMMLVQLVDEVLVDSGGVDATGNPIRFPIAEPLKGVMGRTADDVFAVGPRGSVWHFDGARFTREDTATSRPLADVFTGAGVWAAATDGVLLRRRDDGWNDTDFVAPAPVFLQGIWSRGDDDVVAVGLAPRVFHRTGAGWTVVDLDEGAALRAVDGATLADVDPADDNPPGREFIAVGAGGRIVRGPTTVAGDGEEPVPARPHVVEED